MNDDSSAKGATMQKELNTPPTEIRLREQRAYWITTACIIAVFSLFVAGYQEYRIYKLKMEHINTANVLLQGQNMALEKLTVYETIEKKQ